MPQVEAPVVVCPRAPASWPTYAVSVGGGEGDAEFMCVCGKGFTKKNSLSAHQGSCLQHRNLKMGWTSPTGSTPLPAPMQSKRRRM